MKISPKAITIFLIVVLAAFLRFYKISSNPPGLYWDEAAFGYDAYSILKTAQDHHGHFLPLFFESFGDWKLPLYHYLLIPSIAAFGLNEFAVRFPSALLGTLTVPLLYLLVKALNVNGQVSSVSSKSIALFSAFFLAISPWHIQFSRGGFESTAGLFLIASGVFLFLLGITKNKLPFLILSFLFFVLSMYTYHTYRIFTPLLVLSLLLIFRSNLKTIKLKLIIPIAFAVFLSLPLLKFTLSPEGRARAISQSIFKLGDFETAKIEYDQKSQKSLRFLSKYLYLKPAYCSFLAVGGYIDHFSPTFLFFKGDQIGRHSQVDMGQFYVFDALFILTGLFVLKSSNFGKIMLVWLFLAPIPASIVTPTPHANRTLQMVIPLTYLSALGTHQIFKLLKSKPIKIILILFCFYWFVSFLHLIFIHYPKKFAADWQSGYRQMVEKIKKHEGSFEKVYVTNINQVPYIYLLFYGKYDPQRFIQLSGSRDNFDKYVFIPPETNIYDKGRILYVAPSWQKVDGVWIDSVDDFAGRHIYSLWEVGQGP